MIDITTSRPPAIIIQRSSVCPIKLIVYVFGHTQEGIIYKVTVQGVHDKVILIVVVNRGQMSTLEDK